ncbi:hypothetical protein Q7C36_000934 [Tachysurus vachellii]|uniref:Secreted protein n=1 Tax=Tachysurus vachellii TaxID=175792 RepID=A0AA88NWX8_TACVA|nr:hypothetical protein Q7C36_000934 [Tachysurus vachellii]
MVALTLFKELHFLLYIVIKTSASVDEVEPNEEVLIFLSRTCRYILTDFSKPYKLLQITILIISRCDGERRSWPS